ncbi:PIN domain-containing protein [Dehalococcoides mccartyi]|uniref:PIN domain-containing protein n=1 Tax=Dehalococcoides mccartyi TaxID=61435 RepID=UPI001A09D7E6|nr:PIN domain-containing protein [Dehalococcoides mccartyi]MBF4483105.1 hypothetical protein [Dehalococcoides mccartyi]MBJ7531432.1 hypothetical protein [Dehalococcoides mccartyi]
MAKIAFLDTNVFLHYQPFDQIVWPKILQVSEVTIIVPPIIIRELNKHKELGAKQRVRERAGLVLKKLSSLFATGCKAYIRDGVEIYLEDRDPIIDFTQLQLNKDIQDDHLIASIIMFRKERPEADVILVSSDSALTLIGKSRRHNIQVTILPANLRLPEELDQEQSRIRELEKKVRDLELKSPQISMVFADGNQHAGFTLQKPMEMTEAEIVEKTSLIQKQYRKMEQQPKQKSEYTGQLATIAEAMANINASMGNILLPEDIARYNTELDQFFKEYAEYLQNGILYENMRRRTVKLLIFVANDGTSPAEDIDVFLHFPDGFEIMNEASFPKAPKPPNPPDTPKTQMQRMMESVTISPNLFSPIMGRIPNGVLSPRNISTPNIRKTRSYEVTFDILRIKHKLQEAVEPLYILFESYDAAKSFQIEYRLLAANIPTEVTGQLHVIINKDL